MLSETLALTHFVSSRPSLARSSGTGARPTPGCSAVPRAADGALLAVDEQAAAALGHAVQPAEERGLALASEATDAHDLAGPNRERDLVHGVADAQPAYLEPPLLGRLARPLREEALDAPAEHGRHELVDRRGVTGERAHALAVAKDGDAIRDRHHLGELVRDVDDDPAVGGVAAGELEQPVRLLASERRGGLVQDQHLRLPGVGLRDLDDLALGQRQVADAGARVDGLVLHLVEDRPAGRAQRARRDDAGPRRLPPVEQVLGDGQVRQQAELLEAVANAGPKRRRDAVERQPAAVEVHAAGVRQHRAREDLDEGALAGAVLADPPCTSPRLHSSEAPSRASTPP